MNILDIVKAIIRLSKSERRKLLAILRADCPDEWREAEHAPTSSATEAVEAATGAVGQ
jgi:hypothetical protein